MKLILIASILLVFMSATPALAGPTLTLEQRQDLPAKTYVIHGVNIDWSRAPIGAKGSATLLLDAAEDETEVAVEINFSDESNVVERITVLEGLIRSHANINITVNRDAEMSMAAPPNTLTLAVHNLNKVFLWDNNSKFGSPLSPYLEDLYSRIIAEDCPRYGNILRNYEDTRLCIENHFKR